MVVEIFSPSQGTSAVLCGHGFMLQLVKNGYPLKDYNMLFWNKNFVWVDNYALGEKLNDFIL